MEKEAELTGQTELLLAKVVLDQTTNRLQEIKHLEGRAGELVRETGRGKDGVLCEPLQYKAGLH